jgi:hypothetical protein
MIFYQFHWCRWQELGKLYFSTSSYPESEEEHEGIQFHFGSSATLEGTLGSTNNSATDDNNSIHEFPQDWYSYLLLKGDNNQDSNSNLNHNRKTHKVANNAHNGNSGNAGSDPIVLLSCACYHAVELASFPSLPFFAPSAPILPSQDKIPHHSGPVHVMNVFQGALYTLTKRRDGHLPTNESTIHTTRGDQDYWLERIQEDAELCQLISQCYRYAVKLAIDRAAMMSEFETFSKLLVCRW